MSIYAVIPTFNRKGLLSTCLDSLARQTLRPCIVVADSGSSDGTRTMLESAYPDVRYELGHRNLWWTGATNLALRRALSLGNATDWVLCLNDDTELEPDYLEKLLGAARRRPKRIVGSVIVATHAPQTIVDGGNVLNWLTAAHTRFNAGRRLHDFPAGFEQRVNVLPGRGTLFPMQAFQDCGQFAEKALPHYSADYEFSARCARAGYDLIVAYDAVVRSRVDLTGYHEPFRRLSMREAYRYFSDPHASTNLRDRFFFSWLTRRNVLQALIFFLMSVMRIAGHYLRRPAGVALLKTTSAKGRN